MALYSLQSLFCKLYSIRGDGNAMRFAICYSFIAGALTLAANGFEFAPSGATLALGAINAVVLLIYNLSMVRAGGLGSYAFMMVCVLSGGIILPMIYDILFVSGEITALRAAAAAIMITAFILMNIKGISGKKSAKFLLLCATLFIVNGLYGVLMYIQQDMNNGAQRSEMIVITFVGTAIIAAACELISKKRGFISSFAVGGKPLLYLILSALSAAFAVNLLMYVITRVNLTVMNVVNNGGVFALSAVFAIVLFKEKPDAPRVVGLILALLGIVMLCV